MAQQDSVAKVAHTTPAAASGAIASIANLVLALLLVSLLFSGFRLA